MRSLSPDAARPLLALRDVTVALAVGGRALPVVDRVSLTLERGRALGIVGESGCGKSMTALSILRLLPRAATLAGSITFDGRELTALDAASMRAVRGAGIALMLQEAMTSLNPVMTVGAQIAEAVRVHRRRSRAQAWARAVEVLGEAGIDAPEERARALPHALSGGQRQRALLALALVCEPEALIADEPTTALDVTLQAAVLARLRGLQRERQLALLLISHDLGVVAATCDVTAIMYAGQIVEQAPTTTLFRGPRHPYTAALIAARPEGVPHRQRLAAIAGRVPRPEAWPAGCRFQDRCPRAIDRCRREEPPLIAHEVDHLARCFVPLRESRRENTIPSALSVIDR